ncbi:hypothetical protein DFH29DRAFT_1003146 [Suillus ampliporus]|nr:hypothetical protein DFH29DRAFT_1003146 [Suillus ampliporus]
MHFFVPFKDCGNTLPHAIQQDSVSCGLFALNTIAHNIFGDPLGIPNPTSTRAWWFKRITQLHIQVPPPPLPASTSTAAPPPPLLTPSDSLLTGQTEGVTEKKEQRQQLIRIFKDKANTWAAEVTCLKQEKEVQEQNMEVDMQEVEWLKEVQSTEIEMMEVEWLNDLERLKELEQQKEITCLEELEHLKGLECLECEHLEKMEHLKENTQLEELERQKELDHLEREHLEEIERQKEMERLKEIIWLEELERQMELDRLERKCLEEIEKHKEGEHQGSSSVVESPLLPCTCIHRTAIPIYIHHLGLCLFRRKYSFLLLKLMQSSSHMYIYAYFWI